MAQGPSRSEFAPRRSDPCFCGSGRRFKACCGSFAPDRQPPFGVGIVRGFLDPETCQAWIAALSDEPRRPLGTLVSAPEFKGPGQPDLDIARGDGRITDLVRATPIQEDINAMVRRACCGPIRSACGHDFEWFEHPQVLRYGPGGRYAEHADADQFMPETNGWSRTLDRDMSLLVYLNGDFEGGGLNFTRFHWQFAPRTGDLVFFPSDQRYAHRAETVTAGQRWVVVCWAAFRDGERVHGQPTPESIPL